MPIDFRRSWSDEELELYRDNVVRFIETEMVPNDEASRKRGHVGHEIWRKAGSLGLLCADIPEEYGGGGGDFRHEAVFYEECARRGLSGMSTSVHAIVAHYFLNHGTEAQKRHYLPRMARGELVGAIAMTEPGAGSDLQGVRTRADKKRAATSSTAPRPSSPTATSPAWCWWWPRPTRHRAPRAPRSSSSTLRTARAFAWAACSTRSE